MASGSASAETGTPGRSISAVRANPAEAHPCRLPALLGRGPISRAGMACATLLALALGAPASARAARLDGPAPAPAPSPAAQDAPGAAPPVTAPPPTVQFLADDLIRRADGMLVRFYRSKYVSPAVLVEELSKWKSAKAELTVSGSAFAPAPAITPPGGNVPARPQGMPPQANVLRIVETEDGMPLLDRILRIVDVPQLQVRIEAKVLELTWEDQIRIGVSTKLTRPAGDTFLQSIEADFPNPIDAVNGSAATFRRAERFLVFDYAIEAVEQGARAEVVSRPSILVSQGELAILRAGDEEPFVEQNLAYNAVSTTTRFKPVGIRLEVQPLFIGDGAVRVRVSAEASRVSDFRVTATSDTQQVVNAVISTRNADTVVTVPDRETLVVGGLEQTSSRDQQTGFPFLQKIPVLGYLFGATTKRKQKTELYFYITISIETPEEARQFVPPSEKARLEGDRRPKPD